MRKMIRLANGREPAGLLPFLFCGGFNFFEARVGGSQQRFAENSAFGDLRHGAVAGIVSEVRLRARGRRCAGGELPARIDQGTHQG